MIYNNLHTEKLEWRQALLTNANKKSVFTKFNEEVLASCLSLFWDFSLCHWAYINRRGCQGFVYTGDLFFTTGKN